MFDSFETVDWDTACEFCLAPRAIRLAYFRGRDPSQEAGARVARSLEAVGALRFGQLFRCRSCGRPWYDAANGLCTSVERSWLPVLTRWNDRPLAPTEAHVLSMRTIGAVHWSWCGETEVRIPCTVCVAGFWYDPALAILQNRPLLMWKNPAPEVFYVDEVEVLASSEFALPHKLRQRGATAPEKAMGYAPHSAYWGDIQVSLNGLVEFWGADGQMGMDLSTRPERGDWRPRALDARPFSNDLLTYVMGDLTDYARKQL